MQIRKLFSVALLALAGLFALPWAAHAVTDSTSIPAPGTLEPSNCPNINDNWYPAGVVPSGYFKSNGAGGYEAGNCYPLPNCPGGTAWNSTSQSCQSICGAGTAWNGSTCASICTGGQTWNGVSCVCPTGMLWNGTSCGNAPTLSASMSPASVTVGASSTLTWSASAGSTVTLSCSGAGTYSGAKTASGSQAVALTKSGTLTCVTTASNSYGTASLTRTATAGCASGSSWNGTSCVSVCSGGQTWNGSACVCPSGSNWNGSSCVTCAAGTTWSGSSCVSVCSGGQAWNGSACVCPTGQTWNGSACGVPPSFVSFSVSPANQLVGSAYNVAWDTNGHTPMSVVMTCTGANAATFALSPPGGGTGSLPNDTAGSTNCSAKATSSWGTVTRAASAVLSSCPAGTSWNGSTCISAAQSACDSTSGTWSGGACYYDIFTYAGAYADLGGESYVQMVMQGEKVYRNARIIPESATYDVDYSSTNRTLSNVISVAGATVSNGMRDIDGTGRRFLRVDHATATYDSAMVSPNTSGGWVYSDPTAAQQNLFASRNCTLMPKTTLYHYSSNRVYSGAGLSGVASVGSPSNYWVLRCPTGTAQFFNILWSY